MRLDHIAYRVRDRHRAAELLIDTFGYRIQAEFDINFDDGSTTECIALQPAERHEDMQRFEYSNPWTLMSPVKILQTKDKKYLTQTPEVEYHMAPEVFISDGSPDSIVGKWVEERGGYGGVHHLAYQVEDVESMMMQLQHAGLAEFESEKPLKCPGLTQVFTKPIAALGGIVWEFIKREGDYGFCRENVRDLMLSTGGVK